MVFIRTYLYILVIIMRNFMSDVICSNHNHIRLFIDRLYRFHGIRLFIDFIFRLKEIRHGKVATLVPSSV